MVKLFATVLIAYITVNVCGIFTEKHKNALCYNYFVTAMPRYPKLKLIQIKIKIHYVSIASLKENK